MTHLNERQALLTHGKLCEIKLVKMAYPSEIAPKSVPHR